MMRTCPECGEELTNTGDRIICERCEIEVVEAE